MKGCCFGELGRIGLVGSLAGPAAVVGERITSSSISRTRSFTFDTSFGVFCSLTILRFASSSTLRSCLISSVSVSTLDELALCKADRDPGVLDPLIGLLSPRAGCLGDRGGGDASGEGDLLESRDRRGVAMGVGTRRRGDGVDGGSPRVTGSEEAAFTGSTGRTTARQSDVTLAGTETSRSSYRMEPPRRRVKTRRCTPPRAEPSREAARNRPL